VVGAEQHSLGDNLDAKGERINKYVN